MTADDEIRRAIIHANKLGARGIQVTGYIEPQLATDTPELKLICQIPGLRSASEGAWYD